MTRHSAYALAIVLAGSAAALAPSGGGEYDLNWTTIAGGGEATSPGGYQLALTIGQPTTGEMSGGGYTFVGGFWAVESGEGVPCPADTNGDKQIDVQDLVQVILNWGECLNCPADINNDGFVDVEDLVSVILGWGGCA